MIKLVGNNGMITVSKRKMAEIADVSKSTFRRDVKMLIIVAKDNGRTLKKEADEVW